LSDPIFFDTGIFPEDDPDQSEDTTPQHTIHLRIFQRNSRQCVTTIEGLAEDLNLKKILKSFKKTFHCNGSIKKEESSLVLLLQGDHRDKVASFIVESGIAEKGLIKIHGF